MDRQARFNRLIQRNVLLSDHSSYAIGGKADFFAMPRTMEELVFLLEDCRQKGISFQYFGYGTNILFPDHPKKDMLYLSLKHLTEAEISPGGLFLSCGIPLSVLALIGELMKLEEFYFTYLLPGSVGSGIYINAKCYDDQMSSILKKVYYIDLESGSYSLKTINAEECSFGYKKSVFQSKPWLITGADFALPSFDHNYSTAIDHLVSAFQSILPQLSQLKAFYRYFSGQISSKPSQIQKIEDDRSKKKHFDFPSCGSVFKNNHSFGTPTGVIIDKLGLKGTRIGGAMISPHHGNFIINDAHASASDITSLIKLVQDKVYQSYGFIPEPEVIILDEN